MADVAFCLAKTLIKQNMYKPTFRFKILLEKYVALNKKKVTYFCSTDLNGLLP
jgi:hypothetical protein